MKDILSKEDMKFFRRKGYLLKTSFFNSSLCESVLKELAEIDHQNIITTKNIRTTYLNKDKNKNNDLFFKGMTYLQRADLVCSSLTRFMNLKLLHACSELLDLEDIFFNDNEIHIRQPKVKHIIPAHQDNFYFSLERGLALTCYVYLTKQNRSSGGLGFFPSNINNETISHEKSNIEGFSSFNKLKENIPDEFEYPQTKSGDVVFHHCQTFHRADPNYSEKPTLSLSIRAFSSSNLKKDDSIYSLYRSNLEFNRDE